MSADAAGSGPDGSLTDDDLLAMLSVIRDADAELDTVDNAAVGRLLGWAADVTATRLHDAKARLLIWGVRVGGQPGPCFVDLELTVQGKRLLRASAAGQARTAQDGSGP